MTTDVGAITERLAAQDPAEKEIRNRLISEGCGLREATARAARMTGRVTSSRSATSQKAIAEAAAQAVASATAARRAAKKAAKRATAEAAAKRVIQERQRLAAQFTETAIGEQLREASGGDLAAIASAALSGTGQPGPAARPVAEVATPPSAMDLEELGLAAVLGSAGSSPFWGGATAGQSPFWRDSRGASNA